MILQIGDIIYKASRYSVSAKFTIDRVTEKRAFIGGMQFVRDTENGKLKQVGGLSDYATSWYYVETPELKEKFENKQMTDKIANVQFETLSTEKINLIYKTIFE